MSSFPSPPLSLSLLRKTRHNVCVYIYIYTPICTTCAPHVAVMALTLTHIRITPNTRIKRGKIATRLAHIRGGGRTAARCKYIVVHKRYLRRRRRRRHRRCSRKAQVLLSLSPLSLSLQLPIRGECVTLQPLIHFYFPGPAPGQLPQDWRSC